MDEERRLFYVAMTRAGERLFFSHAKKRNVYGKFLQREISPFVKDIEENLIRVQKSRGKKQKKESQLQLGLF
jgi:DNA helicase-2/ATP-dependent DNA helicase PcrA